MSDIIDTMMLSSEQMLKAVIDKYDLKFSYQFIPFSLSRNRDNKHKSFNYYCVLERQHAGVYYKGMSMGFDYSMGVAHSPTYKNEEALHQDLRLDGEVEYGKQSTRINWRGKEHDVVYAATKPILPDDHSVLASLSMDAAVLDYRDFEDWAESMGENTDSRKAEKTYHECLALALKLRYLLGDDGMRELQEAARDY